MSQSINDILTNCFIGSALWRNFLAKKRIERVSYYPSAGTDLHPLLYSDLESLELLDILTKGNYHEPDLYIFSDYFPYNNSTFFDHHSLFNDHRSSVRIIELCELYVNPEHFDYKFYQHYCTFEAGRATGRAVFFICEVHSVKWALSKVKHGIYFFYENVALIEQLFIRHNTPLYEIVWIRDGSGLGGGRHRHNHLLWLITRNRASYFWVWNFYIHKSTVRISSNDYSDYEMPAEIKQDYPNDFELDLEHLGTVGWGEDLVNFFELSK